MFKIRKWIGSRKVSVKTQSDFILDAYIINLNFKLYHFPYNISPHYQLRTIYINGKKSLMNEIHYLREKLEQNKLTLVSISIHSIHVSNP